MIPRVTLRRAMEDPNLLAPSIAGDSWAAWRVLLLAIMGEALTDDELPTFRRLTGRHEAPSAPVEECAVVAGRRGGKTRAMAVLAAYIAALCDHRGGLARGERAVVLLIAPDTRQARVALDYADGILSETPILRALATGRNAESISLSTGIDIVVRAASFRRLRGLTAVAVFADEACFWHSDESANPDTEILAAARPTLATTGGPLIIASSPHARRGEVYALWRRHFGPEGDPAVLVAQGASRDLNPSLSQSVVDRALERDPAAARAEYLAQWRDDVDTFVSREVIEACVSPGLTERGAITGIRYIAFVDPSGGSSDSMTLGVAHLDERGTAVLDVIRERRAPFSPGDVVTEFADVLATYGVTTVVGDRYAGEWPREAFRDRGVRYDCSDRSKSDIYRDFLAILNTGQADLLDVPRLISQLAGLERRTARGGRDSIDHAPGGHDDVANAAAGAVRLALGLGVRPSGLTVSFYNPLGTSKKGRNGVDPNREVASRIGDTWYRAVVPPGYLDN